MMRGSGMYSLHVALYGYEYSDYVLSINDKGNSVVCEGFISRYVFLTENRRLPPYSIYETMEYME